MAYPNQYRRVKRVATRTMVEKWVSQIAAKHYNEPRGEEFDYTCCSAHTAGNALYSYQTPIAAFKRGKFTFNARKYSVTTSKLQGYVRFAIARSGIPCEEADLRAVEKAMA